MQAGFSERLHGLSERARVRAYVCLLCVRYMHTRPVTVHGAGKH